MNPTKLIIVGGFLGAGKTSLLMSAAELLKKRGIPVGLVTNDQADGLVDTAYLEGNGNIVAEVSGSCFCCNFPGFMDAVKSVTKRIGGGVTLAEPVGSCTDLSMTILQPLKEKYADVADTAPLTVLGDPKRLRRNIKDRKIGENYIPSCQFDEADIILISKIDLLSEEELDDLIRDTEDAWPDAKVMAVSVRENRGVEEWLDAVLAGTAAGKNRADVDYDVYAAGEASYGWLNASCTFDGASFDFDRAAEKLLELLAETFDGKHLEVGHVKFLLDSGEAEWIGNLTGRKETGTLRKCGHVSEEKKLVVNARVEAAPLELQNMVLKAVNEVFREANVTGTEVRTLIPGRPNPTYRYDYIVN
ncbi:MAG: CobW-like GTP-binding protein [Lachnospiraceae bacterium]|jgi:G3E family GTPase|nr:CobW-like GTP-binding protein [Lachnospiraceae bacterium]